MNAVNIGDEEQKLAVVGAEVDHAAEDTERDKTSGSGFVAARIWQSNVRARSSNDFHFVHLNVTNERNMCDFSTQIIHWDVQ